jgi:hypothetical protein
LSSFVQVSTARATRAEGLRLDGARSFAFTVGTDRPETTVCWVRHLDWARARVQKGFGGLRRSPGVPTRLRGRSAFPTGPSLEWSRI